MRFVVALLLALVIVPPARAEDRLDLLPYKDAEDYPWRNFNGVDFLEPFAPAMAARDGDWGRIFAYSAIPYALLLSSFAIDDNTDHAVSHEIVRWKGLELDKHYDSYPYLFGILALDLATMFIPAPEDEFGYNWDLRLDRFTVFGVAMVAQTLLRELTVPIFNVPRPDGSHYTSINDARPAGHIGAAFAGAAFASHMLREWLEPEREPSFLVRVGEEALFVLPYLPAVYVILERVKTHKHTLVDCLTGAGMGAFVMNLFYSWSFDRWRMGRGWIDSFDLAYDPQAKAFTVAISGKF